MAEITDSMFQPVPKPLTTSKSYQQRAAENADAEKPPRRKLPWLIDIFLYPVCRAGLIMLAVLIGIPLFVELLKIFMSKVAMVFPPMLVFFFFVFVAGGFVKLVALLYIYWYLCQCIRSSAEGCIRAPDTIGETPGISEMFWQFVKILLCLVIFASPAILYYRHTLRTDTMFSILVCTAGFLYPMALLSVIMFDSVTGMNPVIVIGSIFSTLFHYCGLVAVLIIFGFAAVKAFMLLRESAVMSWVMLTAHIYFLMVAAHLLGRFYYKSQEKLNWEV